MNENKEYNLELTHHGSLFFQTRPTLTNQICVPLIPPSTLISFVSRFHVHKFPVLKFQKETIFVFYLI